jgi:hypothetical protein
MKTVLIRRRQFLRAAGGMLGLPFLPSLVANAVHAQAVFVPPKRFVALCSWHGGLAPSNVYPTSPSFNERSVIDGTWEAQAAPLVRTENGAQASISRIGTAAASALTSTLASKMSVLRGLSIPWYIAHHTAGLLGNYARNDGNGPEGVEAQAFPNPTIDQFLAQSPSFYGADVGVRARNIVMGPNARLSWGHQVPSDRSTPLVAQEALSANRAFDALYVAPSTGEPVEQRPLLVDRLLSEYQSLRQSNRRLGQADRVRLDAHIARLDELERRLRARPISECRDVDVSGDDGNATGAAMAAQQHLQNEVAAMALACGTTRVVVMNVDESRYAPEETSYHDNVAHRHLDPTAQATLVRVNQQAFEHGFVDLCQRLDVEEQPGSTVLDASLVAWQWESGTMTHDNVDMATYLAGSAGGVLRTGLYCDYRDRSDGGVLRRYSAALVDGDGELRPGLPHNQFLATVLTSMGVPPSEFANVPHHGFVLDANAPPASGYGFAMTRLPFATEDSNNGRSDPERTRRNMTNMNAVLPFLART